MAGLEQEKGRIKVDKVTGATSVPGVFAGGEAVRSRDMISAIASAKNAAAAADRLIRQNKSTLEGIGPVETVDRDLVLRRHGYIKKDRNFTNLAVEKASGRIANFKLTTRVMTEEEAVREAGRCLNCGCGEGCQICKTICVVFAPYISAPDTLHIDRDSCVACGMCALRCPIQNIEMVNLGTRI
jgi:heterodisulfide reductase subunit A-like polyferredoxin